MKNILIGTDFSPASTPAMDFGLAIAARLGAKVTLMHVVTTDLRVGAVTAGDLAANMLLDSSDEAREIVEQARSKWEDPEYDFPEVVIDCREGNPATRLTEAGDEIDADLIVVGTKGRTALSNLLLGSVAAKLVHHTARPVLAVPPQLDFAGIHRIAWARDWVHETDDFAVDLLTFASFFQAKIDILTIWTDNENEPREAEAIHRRLMEKLEYSPMEFHFIRADSPEIAIREFVQKHQPDLVAVQTRSRNFLQRMLEKGVTDKLLAGADMALLTFHS